MIKIVIENQRTEARFEIASICTIFLPFSSEVSKLHIYHDKRFAKLVHLYSLFFYFVLD